MKAAVLSKFGEPPQYTEFADPVPGDGELIITMSAAGVHHVDLAKASGRFYAGVPPLPSVVGSDGVGRTADGERVYVDSTVQPYGTWAERCLVQADSLVRVADGVDDVTAAALGNTGMAAWLALTWRAGLRPGDTVLVLAANGALGSIAVQIAKALGAGRVVAADRDPGRLERALERGADATVNLQAGTDLAAELRTSADGPGFDVIIDPLWGAPAAAAMEAAAYGARFVQLGQLAGATTTVAASAIRSAGLNLMGFAAFHAPLDVRRQAYFDLTSRAADGRITVEVDAIPLADVVDAWERQQGRARRKLVLIP